MQAFADVSDALRADRYLAPHFRYYIREVRVMAYSQVTPERLASSQTSSQLYTCCWFHSTHLHRLIACASKVMCVTNYAFPGFDLQFLESYKSVTLESMAKAFGVSAEFLDEELADFIVAGRLPAKIDKVGGIIETNRQVLIFRPQSSCVPTIGFAISAARV